METTQERLSRAQDRGAAEGRNKIASGTASAGRLSQLEARQARHVQEGERERQRKATERLEAIKHRSGSPPCSFQ